MAIVNARFKSQRTGDRCQMTEKTYEKIEDGASCLSSVF